jgi:hypothetical protein
MKLHRRVLRPTGTCCRTRTVPRVLARLLQPSAEQMRLLAVADTWRHGGAVRPLPPVPVQHA